MPIWLNTMVDATPISVPSVPTSAWNVPQNVTDWLMAMRKCLSVRNYAVALPIRAMMW
ncbi:MAG: hypothetical protein U0528_10965 [Anaerolineae bacterium]|nr:hypothetical protein [Anaerolineae bacterium]